MKIRTKLITEIKFDIRAVEKYIKHLENNNLIIDTSPLEMIISDLELKN